MYPMNKYDKNTWCEVNSYIYRFSTVRKQKG